MSFHELLLNRRYWADDLFTVSGFFSVNGLFVMMGLVITTGIGTACVCRINAMRPRRWRISLEQVMYLIFAGWAMEAFTDLLFLQMFSGYDIAIGLGIMLHLHSTYFHWQGDDCVCDALNYWRIKKMKTKPGVNYGRRASDRH